jgi:glycosyltransferase involved in cell wall biosynthesis
VEDTAMKSVHPIKVMQIIARMNVGGPAVLVADLMRNFDPKLVNAVLVTGYCDENESDYLDEVAKDVKAVRVPGFGRSISPLRDLNAFFLLAKEIRKFKPDVIHTHTAKAGVLGRVAGLIAAPSAKRVHTFHGHLLHGYFSKSKTQLVVSVEKLLAVFTFRMIAIGNSVKKDLVDAKIGTDSRYEVIFPGLQPLKTYAKEEAKKSLGLESDKTYLVFVGRLTQIKRPDRLLEIARYLKANQPNSQILIAGAGELLKTIEGVSASEGLPMTFLGWRSDIDLILSAGDISILCSDNEGIPLTLIQASQAGLPIVSTDVGSVRDIVIDGVTGFLTEVSSEGLIQGITRLLEEPNLRHAFGKAGEQRAKDFFSSHSMVEHHERLYSQSL